MSRLIYPKTAAELLDYGWDWSSWLGVDTLLSSAWIVDAGITVSGQSNDESSTKLWLSGGDLAIRYRITNRVTTLAGRTAERSFWVRIVEVRTA